MRSLVENILRLQGFDARTYYGSWDIYFNGKFQERVTDTDNDPTFPGIWEYIHKKYSLQYLKPKVMSTLKSSTIRLELTQTDVATAVDTYIRKHVKDIGIDPEKYEFSYAVGHIDTSKEFSDKTDKMYVNYNLIKTE